MELSHKEKELLNMISSLLQEGKLENGEFKVNESWYHFLEGVVAMYVLMSRDKGDNNDAM